MFVEDHKNKREYAKSVELILHLLVLYDLGDFIRVRYEKLCLA